MTHSTSTYSESDRPLRPSDPSARLSVCPSVLSVCPSVRLSVCRLSVRPFRTVHSPRVRTDLSLSPDVLVVRLSARSVTCLLTTPLLRAIRTKWPGARVTFLTKRQHVPLVSDKSERDESRGHAAGHRPHPRGSDPHGAVHPPAGPPGRAQDLAAPAARAGDVVGVLHHRLARALLIRFKHNSYAEHVPVPERYFEAAADLNVEPDGGPPEFFLNPVAEERRRAGWRGRGSEPRGRWWPSRRGRRTPPSGGPPSTGSSWSADRPYRRRHRPRWGA